MNPTLKSKILSNFLDLDIYPDSEIIDDYLVLTDTQADIQCKQYILDSLWSFNPEFILNRTDYTYNDDYDSIICALGKIQSLSCESANSIFKLLLGDNIDNFIEDAIYADGRGYFLASYNSTESSITYDSIEYFIYRQN